MSFMGPLTVTISHIFGASPWLCH